MLLKTYDINVQIDEVLVNELSDDGTVLYSVLNSGQLWQINKNSGYQTLVNLGKQIDSENMAWYNRIYVDSHKGIWLYSDKTDVIYYQKDAGLEWKEIHLESDLKSESNVVLDIMDDENGQIWIGTDHEGIFVYDRANSTYTNLLHDPENSASVASNNIEKLFKDDRGIIWTGHNKKGISYCHDSFRNFKSISHKECKDISAILEDRNGNIWLGTDGNGLFLKGDSGKGAIRKMPMPNNAVVSLLEDDAGRIWIGTYLKGLFCYEKGKFTNFTKSNSKLESNDIWSLQQDRYGKIWIGSLGGRIQSLYPDRDLLRSEIKSFEGVTYTLDMFYDGGDKLYAATVYGLCVIDIVTGKQTVLLGNQKGTQNFHQTLLLSVYKDKRDLLWIGHSQGLTLWDIKRDSLY
jgi:ligand-binding sensor domain-containing protein